MISNFINPTTTNSWRKLEELSNNTDQTKLIQSNLLSEVKIGGLSFDFSKNIIDSEVYSQLVGLAKECKIQESIDKYFKGAKINFTEDRPVLHTALRNSGLVADDSIPGLINDSLTRIESFTRSIISGEWKGYSGKSIDTIVNIGIGGSDLGPKMVTTALKKYRNHLRVEYVSTLDEDYLDELSKTIDLETTLFIIVSKTFTTVETINIANYFLAPFKEQNISLDSNVIAVSSTFDKVNDFGIPAKNIFSMWNWVGGRFSLWSAVGLSTSLAIGFDNYKKLLEGAALMDNHFASSELKNNIPLMGALISIWYNNFLSCQSEAIVTYSAFLDLLVPYLQQVFMESNGKSIDRNGEKVNYNTGNVIWGGVGTENQHAYMQLLHQGTYMIPMDFIGVERTHSGKSGLLNILNANIKGQVEALYKGRSIDELSEDVDSSIKPYKTFEGSKPTTLIMLEQLTPKNLGSLIAYYEHRVFVQGIILNINSFDQFGVELGKELAKKYANS